MATIRFTPSTNYAPIGEIEAEEVGYGLVIHPPISAGGVLILDGAMSISEPITGCRVAFGMTREAALADLEEVVLEKGGPEEFLAALRRGIDYELDRRHSKREVA